MRLFTLSNSSAPISSTSVVARSVGAQVLASDRIVDQECWGDAACVHAAEPSAQFIREAIERDKEDRKTGFDAA